LKLYKVQNISLNQTLFMERRNLYSVDIHTAAGTLTLPFVAAATAFELSNYLLYQVSCSNKKWM
jgi:putative membrane protein